MLIQTIDYKSNKIDRAYKNGVMIWHRLNLKYFGFDPVNVFLVNKNIVRTPFTKEMGLLNDKIRLMNQNELCARASRRGSTFVGIGANIFDELFSSQSRQISKEELISTLLFQSLFSSPAKCGMMEPGIETFINVFGASSHAVAQISQIFVDIAISSSFRQSKSQSMFINNLFLNQTIAFLENSESFKLFISEKAVAKNLSLITISVPDKLILVHSANVLSNSDLIKGKILESGLAAAQKIKNIGIFISNDINRTLQTLSIAILKESSRMSKSPIKPVLLSHLLNFKSKILLLNGQEKIQYARLRTKIVNYSILGMSTNLTAFESLVKILFCTKSVLIQQKLCSYSFKNSLNSHGYGILKFLSSHGGYCNFIFDFEDAFVNFGQYKKIGGVNNKIDTWQKNILYQIETLEFQNKKTHIKISDNITLNMISYNALTQDFYCNIKHSLPTFLALNYYYYAESGLHANFYNFAKLDFANDDEKWQYPVPKSEEEIFITQVFNFSYGNKEIK